MSENLIIFNAKVVTPLGFSARKGKEMAELRILEKATVEVVDGIITYVGPNRGEVRDGYYHHFWHYNARGKCLLPGFVDSHTHFVFGGERAEEFSWRLKGESYLFSPTFAGLNLVVYYAGWAFIDREGTDGREK